VPYRFPGERAVSSEASRRHLWGHQTLQRASERRRPGQAKRASRGIREAHSLPTATGQGA